MIMDEQFHSEIEKALFHRVDAVEVDKAGNLLNKAVLSEGFYRGFLNILFGWKLENANYEKQNAPGIDLIDRENRIAVQVSTTCNHYKIQHSISEFANPDGGNWHLFFLAIVNNASKRTKDFLVPSWLSFDKDKDVLDTARLMQIVQSLSGEKEKQTHLMDYVSEKNTRDAISKSLYPALINVRKNHPSFILMERDDIDKRLLPDGKEIQMDAYGSIDGEKKLKIWDFIKSEHKPGFKDIIIEGDGGTGKSVSLLSVTDDKELLMLIPAIYIHLYDLVKDDRVIAISRYISEYYPGCAEGVFKLSCESTSPGIMLLLDGLNEVSQLYRPRVMGEIKKWKEGNPGSQLILASRPLSDEECVSTLGTHARHIRLEILSDEMVSTYLTEQGIKPPIGEQIWDVLKRPLFLMLYTKTANLREQIAGKYYPLEIRENISAGALIWNYLQRQLLMKDTPDWVIRSAFANEFIVPYIAYQMAMENTYDVSASKAIAWVNKAMAQIQLKKLPKHLASIRDTFFQVQLEDLSLPQINWTSFVLREAGLFAENKKAINKSDSRKNGDAQEDIVFSFMHQIFRDCLAGLHLINVSQIATGSIPSEWQDTIPTVLLEYAAELIDNNTADNLWETNRKNQQYDLPGVVFDNAVTYRLLELQKRRRPLPEALDFSGMDLRGMSLTRYLGGGDNDLRLFRKPNLTQKTKLGRSTFMSEGHSGIVNCIAELSKGCVVSGSMDKTLRVWDLSTGQCLQILEGHSHPINEIAVLSNGFVVSAAGNTLRIWNPVNGECIRRLDGHTDIVSSIAISKTGHIVSGSFDKTVRVWDPDSGKCLKTLEDHDDMVRCVAILSNGNIVSGSDDHTIRIWDMDQGICLRTLTEHADGITCLALLPDDRIVSGSVDETVRVWDSNTGNCLHTLLGHTAPVKCITILSDRRVVSGSDDHTMRIWSLNSGKCVRILKGHEGTINCVSILMNGRFVSSSDDKTMCIWDSISGKQIQRLEGHDSFIDCVIGLSDGRIVSGSWDKSLRVWDSTTGRTIHILKGYNESVNSLCVLPDQHIISGSSDHALRIWNLESGKCIRILKGHTNTVNCIAVLPDGRIVSGSDDDTLRLWNRNTGECEEVLTDLTDGINCVAVCKDGRIVSGSDDGLVRIWNPIARICTKMLAGHHSLVSCVAVLPGSRIVTGSHDKTLLIWDSNTGTRKKVLKWHNKAVRCLVVLQDLRIVSGSDDNTLIIWDPDWGDRLQFLAGHTGPVSCVAASEMYVVSGSYDKTIRVWDPDSGQCLHTLSGHTKPVLSVAILPNGRIVSGSYDNTIRVWDVDTEKCIEVLEAIEIDVSKMVFSEAILENDGIKMMLWRNGAIV